MKYKAKIKEGDRNYEKGYYFTKSMMVKKRKNGRKFYLAGVPKPEKFGFTIKS